MQNSNKPKKLKIVLLGNRAVGKSSIIRRFVFNQFPQEIQPTVAVDYMSKVVSYQGSQYRLQLWDTAGQEKYRSLVKGYLKGAHACIYVYDCKNSYMGVEEWQIAPNMQASQRATNQICQISKINKLQKKQNCCFSKIKKDELVRIDTMLSEEL